MMNPLVNKALDCVLSHMPDFVARWVFSEVKVQERITFSPGSDGICLVPGDELPGSIQKIGLTFHNHNPFPVDLDHIEGGIWCYEETVIRNLSLPLKLRIKAHSDGDFSGSVDLPDSQARLIRNRPGDSLLLSIKGSVTLNAIGRKFSVPMQVSFKCTIRRFR